MYKGNSYLAIIPARGGSNRIPRKNIRLVAGKPLIVWTIEEARKSKYLDRVILSSEDQQIIKVAKEYRCEVPFIRPKILAKDTTPGIEPVLHAIGALNEKYDYVVLLQPTSPLRKAIHIDEAIDFLYDKKAGSVVGIREARESPYWMFTMKPNSTLTQLLPKSKSKCRQDLQKIFLLNGAIYIAKTKQILEEKTFINELSAGYLMDKQSSVDVDDMIDLEVAEKLLMKSL